MSINMDDYNVDEMFVGILVDKLEESGEMPETENFRETATAILTWLLKEELIDAGANY